VKRWWHIYDRDRLIIVAREDDPNEGTMSVDNPDKTRVKSLAESTVCLLLGRVTTEASSADTNHKRLCDVPVLKY
jgi:hypothetical protein